MPELSDRAVQMPASPIRHNSELFKRAEEVARDIGGVVHRLDIGNPFDMGIRTETSIDNFDYGPSLGLDELRALVASEYKHFGVTPDNVAITNGGTGAIEMAFELALDHGDKVVVFEPFYPNYRRFAISKGVELVGLRRHLTDGFKLSDESTLDDLVKHSGAKAILVTTPSNPDGVVYSADEWKMINRVATKYDLWVFADLAYKEISFVPFFHPLSLTEMRDKLILMGSWSKSHGICNARVGEFISPFPRHVVEQYLDPYLGNNVPGQQMAITRHRQIPPEMLAANRERYNKLITAACEELDGLEHLGVRYSRPQGAYYIPVQVDGVKNTQRLVEFSMDKGLRDYGEATAYVPLRGFYLPISPEDTIGVNQLRLAVRLNNVWQVRSAIKAFGNAIDQYKK